MPDVPFTEDDIIIEFVKQKDISDSYKYGKETKSALRNCLNYLYTQTKRDKPWKISEDFIETLGSGFNVFRVMNSFYLDSQI